VVVQGNWDADVSSGTTERPAPRWHHHQLGPERNAYLADLPGSHDCMIGGGPARFFHASQVSPFQRIYENAPREAQKGMFSNTDFTGHASQPRLVGYGDIHRPYVLNFDGKTLFNAGSVGNPLDQPLACYCIIEAGSGDRQPSSWSLNVVRVAYDIEAELAFARASDMPDFEHYATELRTAVYRGVSAYGV
jgi:diadenosine tetraphosphatase ApaH/serine/threonine PP2A family protein phosphatase